MNLFIKKFTIITLSLSLTNLSFATDLSKKKVASPKAFLAKIMNEFKPGPNYPTPKSYEERYDLSEWDNHLYCAYDEIQFLEIERELLTNFKKAIKNKDLNLLSKTMAKNGSFSKWPHRKNLIKYKEHFDTTEYDWLDTDHQKKDGNLKSAKKYFSEIKKVDHIEINITNLGIAKKNRIGKSPLFKAVNMTGKLEINFTDEKGNKRIDRGDIVLQVEKQNAKWQILSARVDNALSIVPDRKHSPSFKDVTKSLGLHNVPNYLRKEAIRRGGYTLAISDYNNDNHPDMFIGTWKKGLFYKWDKKTKSYSFDKKNSNLAPVLAKAASFGDFSNANTQDLIVAKFQPVKSKQLTNTQIIKLKNDGKGNFSLINNIINESLEINHPMPIATADFNKDGFLDLYVGYPGAKDFTILNDLEEVDLKKRQDIYFNNKKGSFLTKKSKNDSISIFQKLYPHSAVALDFDLDLDMDLLVIDDRANLSPIYENKGGKLILANKKIGIGNNDYGMGVAASDLNQDGELDLAVSNVNFVSAKRIYNSCATNWDIKLKRSGIEGIKLYKRHKVGKYSDITNVSGLSNPGEGVGGVTFLDYNNDGFDDIYVTNGLWSGQDEYKSQDLSSLFYILTNLYVDMFNFSVLGEFSEITHSHFMNTLLTYKGDILNPKNSKSKKLRSSMAGHQRNKLYRNNHDGTFTDVGFLENVDSIADGYMATTFDYNKDGKMDLVLRNADPGVSTSQFNPIEIYENINTNKRKSVVVSLKAKNSNFDAIGSIVTAQIGKTKLVKHLISMHGTIQGERILHFGLDQSKKIDKLVITWPNGIATEFKDVKPGRYHIEETLNKLVSK